MRDQAPSCSNMASVVVLLECHGVWDLEKLAGVDLGIWVRRRYCSLKGNSMAMYLEPFLFILFSGTFLFSTVSFEEADVVPFGRKIGPLTL